MKIKAMALCALSMAVLSGTASASTGEVRFIGAVTAKTCDLTTYVNGSANNTVQLGTVAPNILGDAVNFTMKGEGVDCEALTDTDTVNISFGGPLEEVKGLGILSGTAKDAFVEIKSLNAKETAHNANVVVPSNNARAFKGDVLKAAGDGAQFEAKLKGGTTPGVFHSTLSYAVDYL